MASDMDSESELGSSESEQFDIGDAYSDDETALLEHNRLFSRSAVSDTATSEELREVCLVNLPLAACIFYLLYFFSQDHTWLSRAFGSR